MKANGIPPAAVPNLDAAGGGGGKERGVPPLDRGSTS